MQEKQLTLKIVNYAKDYLLANYEGFEIKLSRTGDTYPTLSERADMANDFEADVFVSVHINAGGGKGYESYIYPESGPKTTALQNVLNAEIMAAMKGFGDIKAHGDDTKSANFAVLRESNMPAVLTENLYIDSSDSNYLKNEAFIRAVGEAHARGVAKYLGLKQKSVETTPTTSEVKRDLPAGIIGQVKVQKDGLRAIVHANQETIMFVKLEKDRVYNVTANIEDFHLLILDDKIQGWIEGENGENLDLVR